jgi:hypothetical protein
MTRVPEWRATIEERRNGIPAGLSEISSVGYQPHE